MADRLNAIVLATALGAVIDNEDPEDIGVALGILIGAFVLQVSREDDVIDEGIDAIASDAKHAARTLKEVVQ